MNLNSFQIYSTRTIEFTPLQKSIFCLEINHLVPAYFIHCQIISQLRNSCQLQNHSFWALLFLLFSVFLLYFPPCLKPNSSFNDTTEINFLSQKNLTWFQHQTKVFFVIFNDLRFGNPLNYENIEDIFVKILFGSKENFLYNDKIINQSLPMKYLEIFNLTGYKNSLK